jgi:hypothetical protein
MRMTKRQVHQTAKRALKAAQKFRIAAIDADAAYAVYWPEHHSVAARLRSIAELCPSFAVDLLVESGNDLCKDVSK